MDANFNLGLPVYAKYTNKFEILHPKQKREAASVQTSQMNLVLFAQS
jgi:hypothetical protein